MSDILARALANLRVTSRSAKGVSDTSSSAAKPKLLIEGADLASKAEENFVLALEWALGQKLDMPTPEEIEALVIGAAARVSAGLLQVGQGLIREHETKFAMQTRVAQLKEGLAAFFKEMSERLCRGEDPVATAAWIEWQLDARLHPFTDGCGRTTKVVAYWVLVRGDASLPRYESRDRYYELVVGDLETWTAYYRTLCA